MSVMLGVVVAVMAQLAQPTESRPERGSVIFVCEHGSAKSLMAQEWFNRRARERGLSVRAVSFGRTPDAAVPDFIVAALRRDGFDVRAFVPRRAEAAALQGASQIVAIGLQPSALPVGPAVPVETWDDIPPASEQYEAARDALKARIEALLTRLEATSPP
jgi:protein-tyrosine-phosphatase